MSRFIQKPSKQKVKPCYKELDQYKQQGYTNNHFSYTLI